MTLLRRGDALVGALQLVVQWAWWFHPLVWWANRQIAYERERCCDEEVIASLAYQPKRYARCLLSVLELRGQLRWLTAMPGVRSFEVTKRRLEHVMLNTKGFQRKMPWSYWLVVVAGVLLMVPGKGLVADQAQQHGADKVMPAPNNGTTQSSQPDAAGNHADTRVTRLISPDGRRVAYGQIAVGPNGEKRVRIIVGNVDGSGRRALPVEGPAVDEVSWYGNDRIAYVTEHGEDGYRLMDLDGNPAGRLTMPSGCDSFFHQCLSPDGRWIAFCGNYAQVPKEVTDEDERRRFLKQHPDVQVQHGLFVVNLKKQTVTQLIDETVANVPAWSPDSHYLAAGVGHYVAKYPLVIIDVATGEVTRPDIEGVGVAWSPDRSLLAMTTQVVRGGSWRGGIPLDGSLGVWELDAQRLTVVSPPGTNIQTEDSSWSYSGSHSPVWSTDGQWIAYQRTERVRGQGRVSEYLEDVWVVRRNGTQQRKVLNHGATQLAWTQDNQTVLWVHDGRFGRIDLEIDASALGPTPSVPSGEFTIHGLVTDDQGQPLEGVEIHVSRGVGTLFNSTPVTTDANGNYRIHFGPAMMSAGANLQYACTFARKPGYYEKELCQAGNLAMANFKPQNFDEEDWGVAGVVYRGHPYRVDFTMLPAASASLQLVDSQGEPLADYQVRVIGDALYPASSVLWSGKTDRQGRATIESVPLKSYYFSLAAGRAEYKTEPITLDSAKPWHFRLTYDDIDGTLSVQNR